MPGCMLGQFANVHARQPLSSPAAMLGNSGKQGGPQKANVTAVHAFDQGIGDSSQHRGEVGPGNASSGPLK